MKKKNWSILKYHDDLEDQKSVLSWNQISIPMSKLEPETMRSFLFKRKKIVILAKILSNKYK